MQRFREAGTSIADLLYPRACAVCGLPMAGSAGPGRHLCWDCRGHVEYQSVRTFCQRCGRSFEGEQRMPFTCGACREHSPLYDAARSAAHFRDPVRSLLLDFKYHGALWLCSDLADLLEACISAHYRSGDIEALIPVPLHARRWRERGYNQAELLGREVARRLGIPCLSEGLVRVRYTGTQTRLDASHRRANASDAFAVKPLLAPWLEGRSLLVVDDVMTTGATVGDAARALKQAGARQVLVATIARD